MSSEERVNQLSNQVREAIKTNLKIDDDQLDEMFEKGRIYFSGVQPIQDNTIVSETEVPISFLEIDPPTLSMELKGGVSTKASCMCSITGRCSACKEKDFKNLKEENQALKTSLKEMCDAVELFEKYAMVRPFSTPLDDIAGMKKAFAKARELRKELEG